MNIPDPDLIEIFNFIEGRLSSEELAAFRKRISEDDQLRQEVEAYAKLSRGFRQEKLEAMEKKMIEIRQKLPPVRKSDLIPLEGENAVAEIKPKGAQSFLNLWINWLFRKNWSIVVLPVIIFLLIGWFWTDRHFSNEGLAQKYLQLPKTPDPAGGVSAELLFEGYRLFDREKYSEALEKFAAISSNDPYFNLAYLFQAYCQFKTGAYEDAKAKFDSLIENRNYPGITDLNTLRWNSLMCDLALHENGSIEAIENAPNENDQQENLRRDLQSIWRKIALIF